MEAECQIQFLSRPIRSFDSSFSSQVSLLFVSSYFFLEGTQQRLNLMAFLRKQGLLFQGLLHANNNYKAVKQISLYPAETGACVCKFCEGNRGPEEMLCGEILISLFFASG